MSFNYIILGQILEYRSKHSFYVFISKYRILHLKRMKGIRQIYSKHDHKQL